jgi:hypothetical protein
MFVTTSLKTFHFIMFHVQSRQNFRWLQMSYWLEDKKRRYVDLIDKNSDLSLLISFALDIYRYTSLHSQSMIFHMNMNISSLFYLFFFDEIRSTKDYLHFGPKKNNKEKNDVFTLTMVEDYIFPWVPSSSADWSWHPGCLMPKVP